MQLKIMLAGALVLGGFLWSYLFIRQFLFNILVAYPTIKKMNLLQPDLISIGAVRYTRISDIVSLLVGCAILFGALFLCRKSLLLIIAFLVGAVFATVVIVLRSKPSNREMFDLFSNAYARFIPDDELRTIVYNKQYDKVKARLKSMGIRDSFVPVFDKK